MARMASHAPTNIVQGVAILGAVLWGLDLILSRRNQMSRPRRNMLPALVGALLVGSLAGMGAAFVTLKITGGTTGDPLILATIARSSGAAAEMVFLFLGLLL